MSICDLDQIEKICSDNAGGVKALKIILIKDLASIPKQYCTALIEDDIQLQPGKTAYSIPFIKNSCSFLEKQETNSKAGDYFTSQLVFEIAKTRLEVLSNIMKFKNCRVIAVWTDNNETTRAGGLFRVVGDNGTKNKKAERNGFVFQLSTRSEKPFPIFTGNII